MCKKLGLFEKIDAKNILHNVEIVTERSLKPEDGR